MWRHALLRRRHAALGRRDLPEPLAAYARTPLPDTRRPWRETDFVALDIETTGLDPERDAMLSVGWVLVTGGRVELSTAQCLIVRPDKGVGQSATVHGLTDTMVSEGEDVATVLAAILAVLAGRVLLVHYARLDRGIIDRLCREHYGTRPPLMVVDTMELEIGSRRRRHHTDGQKSLRLGDLRSAYALPHYAAHNCLTDAIATAELFLAMARSRGAPAKVRLGDLLS